MYLFFSVNRSGCFCGMAQMISNYYSDRHFGSWVQDGKWQGSFIVKWIYVKDIPNKDLKDIQLPNNDRRPVTFSRDTQEIPYAQGVEMLTRFIQYEPKTNILQDFKYYDDRERDIKMKRTEQIYLQRMQAVPAHPGNSGGGGAATAGPQGVATNGAAPHHQPHAHHSAAAHSLGPHHSAAAGPQGMALNGHAAPSADSRNGHAVARGGYGRGSFMARGRGSRYGRGRGRGHRGGAGYGHSAYRDSGYRDGGRRAPYLAKSEHSAYDNRRGGRSGRRGRYRQRDYHPAPSSESGGGGGVGRGGASYGNYQILKRGGSGSNEAATEQPQQSESAGNTGGGRGGRAMNRNRWVRK